MSVSVVLALVAYALFNVALYVFYRGRFQFWKALNVPCLPPTFIFGNIFDVVMLRQHFAQRMLAIYEELKHTALDGCCGMFFSSEPVLLALTPDFAKQILATDFQCFTDRGVYSNPKIDPMSGNLFFLHGPKWRSLRAKLSPSFTAVKLKTMFHTIAAVSEELIRTMTEMAERSDSVEVKEILARLTTDIIGSCVYGVECNSLRNPNSEFRAMGKRILGFALPQLFKVYLATMYPQAARRMGVRFNAPDVSQFFAQALHQTMDQRRKTGEQRKDFLQTLMDLETSDDEALTFDEIAAQAFVFFFAGYETSATTMTYALHALALQSDIQEKGRKEVREMLERTGGRWSVEGLAELKYLDHVINETLRLWPPVATLHRRSTMPYTLPNGRTLPAGTSVVIPVLAFHRDPEIYSNPLTFNPDRFDEQEVEKRHPFSYLPFGEGPRYCIGMRFGLMQVKLGLAMLLHNFEFGVCARTEIPLKIEMISLMYITKGEVVLSVKRL